MGKNSDHCNSAEQLNVNSNDSKVKMDKIDLDKLNNSPEKVFSDSD